MPQADAWRVLLRLPAGLHAALRSAAAAAGLSLNEYCVRRLAAPGATLVANADAAAAVSKAAALFGVSLVGVAVYGSWARGDAGARSDIDLLIVLDRSVPLTRELYRRWDVEPIAWQGRPVDPHFVHLPSPERVSGVWGEVATDGTVLFERDSALSACLGLVRREIAEQRLVRRTAHGQPYWTRAA